MADNFQAQSTSQVITAGPNQGNITSAYDFDAQYEVKTRMINASKINIDDLVRSTQNYEAKGTFSSSTGVTLITANLASYYYSPNKNKLILGNPYMSVYEGTVTDWDHQIWVRRGGSVSGTYSCQGGFDYQSWVWVTSLFNYPTSSLVYTVNVQNMAGADDTVLSFISRLVYLDYVYDPKKRYA